MTLLSNAEGMSLILGWGARIPHASWPKQNIKQKQYCSKLNKDFKKWSTSKKYFFKKSGLFTKKSMKCTNIKGPP